MITSNEEKANEVDAFPVFLQTIREELGPEKLLSVAVPGLARDQIAFTAEKGPAIWESVDFVNIMTYDLMNRRDTETKHHTSVRDSLAGVKSYLDIGLTPDKANLGFAFYAKYFPTAGDCGAQVLGCPTEPMENADGSDNGKSGVITFERQFMAPPSSTLSVSSNGLCGPDSGKCPEGQCCSQYGYWYVFFYSSSLVIYFPDSDCFLTVAPLMSSALPAAFPTTAPAAVSQPLTRGAKLRRTA